jgi:1,4-alpha-glucan branching enzyme
MSYLSAYHNAGPKRYSAKNIVKPVNFLCISPDAKAVSIVGDFNEWNPATHRMKKHVDGSWQAQIEISLGHHHYAFLIDGKLTLDPRAQGTARNSQGEKVSLLSVR